MSSDVFFPAFITQPASKLVSSVSSVYPVLVRHVPASANILSPVASSVGSIEALKIILHQYAINLPPI